MEEATGSWSLVAGASWGKLAHGVPKAVTHCVGLLEKLQQDMLTLFSSLPCAWSRTSELTKVHQSITI